MVKKILLSSYLLKSIWRAVKIYINKGDASKTFSLKSFAKSILKLQFEALIFSVFFAFIAHKTGKNICEIDIAGDALQVFSGILGFGIAAYTIIISSFDKIIKYLEDKKEQNGFNANIVNSDMVFPLLAITVIILLFVLISILENSFLRGFASVFLFIYGILLTLEILMDIYAVTTLVIGNMIKELNKTKETDER